MSTRLLAALGLFVASAPAFAASDLTTSISTTSGTYVYQSARYTVAVSNVGNRDASNGTVVIQLPRTNTSPTVHVMGTMGAKSAACTQSGTALTCSLGTVRKGRSTSVYFDITLPESVDPITFTATASTTSAENSTANNGATRTASLLNYDVAFTAPAAVLAEHCTGTDLASYFECELYPSSISSHETTLNADHTITFPPEAAGYTGTWSQTGADHLTFTYFEAGEPVATFEGYGVDADCWEGLTTFFPDDGYVSMYRVCVQ